MLMELHKVDFQGFIFEILAIQLLCNITTGSPEGGGGDANRHQNNNSPSHASVRK